MPITNNKDIVQSYILTTSHYHFAAAEKRVMYQIVNLLQRHLQGLKLDEKHSLSEDLFGERGYRRITMPISDCLRPGDDTNYKSVKHALKSLERKYIEYDDGDRWESFNMVTSPVMVRHSGLIQFDLHWRMYDAFMDFTKGKREFELLKAMQFDSTYSMRLYEMLCGEEQVIDYKIETLRSMWGLEDKYNQTRDFIKRTINVAKKELDEKGPWTFDYDLIKKGRAVHKIRFRTKYQPQHRDSALEAKKLSKRTSVRWELTEAELHYLENQYEFTSDGIKNNMRLFLHCKKKGVSLVDEFSALLPLAREKNSPQGWLIRTLQKKTGWKKE